MQGPVMVHPYVSCRVETRACTNASCARIRVTRLRFKMSTIILIVLPSLPLPGHGCRGRGECTRRVCCVQRISHVKSTGGFHISLRPSYARRVCLEMGQGTAQRGLCSQLSHLQGTNRWVPCDTSSARYTESFRGDSTWRALRRRE